MIIEDKACKSISSRGYRNSQLRWSISVSQGVLSSTGNFTPGQLRAACNILAVERRKLKAMVADGHKDWAYNHVQKTGYSIREIEVGILGLIRRLMQIGNQAVGYEEKHAAITEELKRRDYEDLNSAQARTAAKYHK